MPCFTSMKCTLFWMHPFTDHTNSLNIWTSWERNVEWTQSNSWFFLSRLLSTGLAIGAWWYFPVMLIWSLDIESSLWIIKVLSCRVLLSSRESWCIFPRMITVLGAGLRTTWIFFCFLFPRVVWWLLWFLIWS